MSTVFTKVIEGELPGRFVWRDDTVVAFLAIAPFAPGHTLVVPIEPVDHWLDLDPDVHAHLWSVARTIGRAQREAFVCERVGVMVIGEEVPHAHVHLVPFTEPRELSQRSADPNPDPAALDDHAERIRVALREQGEGAHVPS